MKKIIFCLKNNFWIYFIVFCTLLSIVSIIAGITALKTDRYGDPFLAVVPLSSACWFLFAFFAKNPGQKENAEEIEEAGEIFYNDRYAKLADMLAFIITFIVGTIFLTDISMLVIIGLKAFIAHSAYVF